MVIEFVLITLISFAGNDSPVAEITPLAETLPALPEKLPGPGGYFPGLTKPLMVEISARIWGPGIETPSPKNYCPGLTKPLQVDVSARIFGTEMVTPLPGGEFIRQRKR